MRALGYLLLTASLVCFQGAGARAQDAPVVALDSYTCADFLRDAKEPGDGVKLLRSLMMIAWAAGYTAAQQDGPPRADPAAVQLVSGALGDSCRKAPANLVVRTVTEMIAELSKPNGISSVPAAVDARGSAPSFISPKPLSSSAGGFLTYDNFDLQGSDLRTIKKIELPNCLSTCQTDRTCSAFAYDKWNKWCFLKSGVQPLTLEPSSIVGIRKTLPSPETSTDEVRMDRRPNKSLLGRPYRTGQYENVEKCETECGADQQCVGYSYATQPLGCKFFDRIESFASEQNTISATKTQNRP
jgi:hypothetical protein